MVPQSGEYRPSRAGRTLSADVCLLRCWVYFIFYMVRAAVKCTKCKSFLLT
jgi:hypothetical protein